jgi:hypothetical protein
MVSGKLKLSTEDTASVMVGKYSRPPKYSTDRKKDAETMLALQEAGISKTTSFEMFGFSFEDETELKQSESEFSESQSSDGSSDMSNNAQDAESASTPTEDQGPEMAGDTMTDDSYYNQGATGRAG